MNYYIIDDYIQNIYNLVISSQNIHNLSLSLDIEYDILYTFRDNFDIIKTLLNHLKNFINICNLNNLDYNDELNNFESSIIINSHKYIILHFLINKLNCSNLIINNNIINIEDEEYVEDEEEDDYILNPKIFFAHQHKCMDKIKEQNFKSGIVAMIMGSGKSFLILNTIQQHFSLYKENKIYIIYTRSINILDKLFLKDGKLDPNKINTYAIDGIINMNQFNFYENLHYKKMHIFDLSKPCILIINEDYMKTIYKDFNVDDIGLIINDECHAVSANQNFTMLEYFKSYGKSIIGFSATPSRGTKKSNANLKSIYSIDGIHLNIIYNYTLLDGLQDGIILPFYHIVATATIDNIDDMDDFIKENINKYICNNESHEVSKAKSSSLLPYKKGVLWTNRIINIDHIEKVLYDVMPNTTIYKYHSKTDYKGYETFYETKNNGLLLCVNCVKEGSDIPFIDYGIFCDCVKKRAIHVMMQCIGRIMRPDDLKLKKYAYIIEIINTKNGEDIDKLTVQKIIDYYKMILNLQYIDNDDLKNIMDNNLIQQMIELFNNTSINEEHNEIQIYMTPDNPCIIKTTITTMDWSNIKTMLKSELEHTIQINPMTILIKEYEDYVQKIKPFNFKSDKEYYANVNNNNLIPSPVIKFNDCWKSWHNFLSINKNNYTLNKKQFYNLCKTNNITTYNQYYNMFNNNKNMPMMIGEYFDKKNNEDVFNMNIDEQ